MNWRLYYPDGVTVDGSDCPVEEAPPLGVQAAVQPHPEVGWEIVSHADYYVWRGGRWWGADWAGYVDYLLTPGWKRVLFGRMLGREEFADVFERANADRAFGIKQGFLPREVRPSV